MNAKGIDPNLWHLVTTSLASDTGQRDGRCVQTGGQDSQMTEFTTITTDSELTIPGFRERAQDAQSSVTSYRQWIDDTRYSSHVVISTAGDPTRRAVIRLVANKDVQRTDTANEEDLKTHSGQPTPGDVPAFVLQLSRSSTAVHRSLRSLTASLHFTAEHIRPHH